MRDWFVSIAGEEYATAVMWTLGALLLLVLILIVLRIIRSFSHGSFAIGGRNRLPRLAVTESAVVDNNRRLILVRRDDVEHLVLIGGPSDVVVEHGIRVGAESERPDVSPHSATSDAAKMEAAARPTPGPRPARDDAPPPGGDSGADERRPQTTPAAAPAVAPVAAAAHAPRGQPGGGDPQARSPEVPVQPVSQRDGAGEEAPAPQTGSAPEQTRSAERLQPDTNTAPAAEPPRAPEAPAARPESSSNPSDPSTVAAPVRPQPEASSRSNGDSPLADARIGPAPEIDTPAPARNRNSLESEMSKLLDNLSEKERQ